MTDRIAMRVAWLLPRRLVYWAAIRLMAHATTGPHSHELVVDTTILDALQRWPKEKTA